jgi:uncharacterized protein (DUF1501 family)
MNRRDFLAMSGLAPLCVFAPSWLSAAESGPTWNRVLVLVELQGGNDGLNTVIPYRDEQYYALRPKLGVARDTVLPLSDDLGFNPALEPLLPLWKGNELALVLGVGYPNPNRSHFRSIEIWETASDSEETLQQGWLARLFARTPPPADFAAHGVVLGGGSGPLAGDAAHIVLHDAEQFVQQTKKLKESPGATGNAALEHLLRVQQETSRAAVALQKRLSTLPSLDTDFPTTPLGRQLATAARLIAARVPVVAIKVAHGSFDTHVNQRGTHDRLLAELAAGLAALRAALVKQNRWGNVLVMSYSEFGRRAAENGSAGTDHGTAAPHFVLGGRVRGGFYGQQPSLTRLNEGDLVHRVDFRSAYATAVQHFLGVKSDFLGKPSYPPLPFLA